MDFFKIVLQSTIPQRKRMGLSFGVITERGLKKIGGGGFFSPQNFQQNPNTDSLSSLNIVSKHAPTGQSNKAALCASFS